MIFYTKGDLFTTPHPYIAHGCNAQGVMNSGVAKTVRTLYPEAYKSYIQFIKNAHQPLGMCNSLITKDGRRAIGNLITQEFYGKDGKRYASVDAIYNSMEIFIVECKSYRDWFLDKDSVITIAIPKIGCGLGGLKWDKDVEPILYDLSKKHNINFDVYEI